MERIDSDFKSRGIRCGGWLYRPSQIENPPVIIMAHGFAAERSFGLPAFAERFAENGMAVFLFDYRHFGDSDGEPRNIVDPNRHCQDWEAAITHVKSIPELDSTRIALWGTSFSGGHVLVTAARQTGISAVVSQIPYVAPYGSSFKFKDVLKGMVSAFRDCFRILAHREPYYMPVIGKPGTFALLNTDECWDGYTAIISQDSRWENKIAARVVFKAALYNPMRFVKRITCPVMLIAAENDSLISPGVVKKAASKISDVTFIQLPCNHFQPYTGEFFDRIVAIETEFLTRHLVPEQHRK